MASLARGSEFAGYRIEAEVGRGGMGVVYRARQVRPAREVALKLITPDLAREPGFRERFERESEIAASIEHPNVIPVYEVDEHDGHLYIAMRYVEGTDLRALIKSGLPHRRAAQIISQVGSALDAAHARGLVHRDVKPGNVLITSTGGQEHAYLTDFGLAKYAAEGGPTKTGEWVGTVDYVAPEQIEGKGVDARTDVYSLACLLYHALTGRVPYPRDSEIAKIFAHLNDRPPPLKDAGPELPEPLEDVVDRGMAKDPEDRYQSAGDLGRATIAASEGHTAHGKEQSVAVGAAAPDGAPARRSRLRRSSLGGARRFKLGAGLTALAAVCAGILLLTGVLGGADAGRPALCEGCWTPAATSEPWQIQLVGDVDLSVRSKVYEIDAGTPEAVVDRIHRQGARAICYVDVGTWEPTRADANRFPRALLGRKVEGFADERWLDIRKRDVLVPIMRDRIRVCARKGFDAVDPDNVDGFANETGFALSGRDQLRFNRAIARIAHAEGLAVGLKNDLDQVSKLVGDFDFAVNEECFAEGECDRLAPFIAQDKPVFGIEYGELRRFCRQSIASGFSTIGKRMDLDAERRTCPPPGS